MDQVISKYKTYSLYRKPSQPHLNHEDNFAFCIDNPLSPTLSRSQPLNPLVLTQCLANSKFQKWWSHFAPRSFALLALWLFPWSFQTWAYEKHLCLRLIVVCCLESNLLLISHLVCQLYKFIWFGLEVEN